MVGAYILGGFKRLRTAYRLTLMSRHLFSTPTPSADARIPYGPDPNHFGDLRLPTKSAIRNTQRAPESAIPIIVVIHGGFWRARYDLDHIGHACAALAEEGFATWSIEYRRVGNEGGGYPGTFLDVAAAADFVRELAPQYNLDLDRVITMGHSAGGHLAMWLAARSRIPEGDPLHTPSPLPLKAAVSLAGVLDLRRAWELGLSNGAVEEFMGSTPDATPERFSAASPIEMLPLGVHQTLVHGTEDDNVPFEISQRYHSAALEKGDPVTFVALRGAGHFEVIDPKMREWRKVVQAVAEALA